MEHLTRYKALLRVYLSSYFTRLFAKNRGFNFSRIGNEPKSAGKKALGVILSVFATFVIVVMLVFGVVGLTATAVAQGFVGELCYVLLGFCQLVILILGGNVILSNLFFSDDTSLLLSLPITPTEAFAAKFTVSYLSQLVISAFFIPVLVTFGVTATISGVAVGASFYILAVLSFLLLPAFPTFLMGVFSAPIMLLVSLFKNKERAKMLFTVLSSLLGMIVYFVIIFGSNFMGGEGDEIISSQSVSTLKNAAKWMIFNYNYAEALLGNNVLVNFILYILECVGSFFVAILLCGVFYRRIMRIMQAGSVVGKHKRNKEETFTKSSLKKALFLKDLRMIFKTPTLLFSSVVGIVLVPVVTILYGRMSIFGEAGSSYGRELFLLGFNYYFVLVMIVCSNSVVGVSVSVEKGGIAVLKTLPVSAMEFFRSKTYVSMVMNAIVCFVYFVSQLFTWNVPLHPLFGALLVVAYFFSGTGIGIWELMRDMEHPNFRYNNINELTRNNKTMLKPTFTVIGIGLVGMITGIVCGSALPGDKIYLGYILFFLVVYIVAALLFFLPYSAMKKKVDAVYDNLEA